jgi:hypothetical protein
MQGGLVRAHARLLLAQEVRVKLLLAPFAVAFVLGFISRWVDTLVRLTHDAIVHLPELSDEEIAEFYASLEGPE